MKCWKYIVLAGILFWVSPFSADAAVVDETGQETMYGIGSVSKIYTTAAVMKLVQEGRVDLDAPLTEYLPEFYMGDSRYSLITPRMLLNHTSGLQGSVYTNSMTLGGASSENHDMLLERLRTQRLKADPGEFAVYCNDGFTLAELMVERITGMSFTGYLKEEFQKPLGIHNLESSQSMFDRNRLAVSYASGNKKLPYESANVIGSGGLYSTAEDVCRFFDMFTDNATGKENPVLTRQSVEEMAVPSYVSETWKEVPGFGSTVAYGLGWDSVKEYPYTGYGIKAWSKGGDTTAYHTAVTVLPEENLTCAVTASGGSSMAASRAVERILMEYLVERGKIREEKEKEKELETMPVPDSLKNYAGFYASGKVLMNIEFSGEDEMYISSVGTRRDTTQTYLYQSDGSFLSQNQDYIASSGSLVSAEGGVYGKTAVRFLEAKDGLVTMTIETTENQPGFGSSSVSVPFAVKTEEKRPADEVTAEWKARENKEYVVVSEQYHSAFYLNDPSVTLTVREECPGYLVVGGTAALGAVLKIKDGSHAEFFQKIPGHAGRDLFDLTVKEEDGIAYLDSQNYVYLDSAFMEPVSELGKTLVTQKKDRAVWYQAGENSEGETVRITAPENGHFYVYRTSKSGLTYIAGSVTGDSGRPISIPKNGKLMFSGEEGAVFHIEK